MVPLNNIGLRIGQEKSAIADAVERVITRGWLVLGPETEVFEKAFADYIGAKHCVGVANGTDAIELALKAVGVSSGDCVATVANAGAYTTTALLAIGAQPFYVDVSSDSMNIPLAEVERALDAGVKSVVVTHLYGLAVAQIEAIAEMCKCRNVPLLEDCAQAHGALVNGRKVGTFGDAASFSFYPTKNLGALGDGGAIVTSNQVIANQVKQLRQYGWCSKYKIETAGARNSRLDEIQAAVLSVFLPHLDEANARRRSIASRYSQSFCHPSVRAPQVYGEEYVAHLYVVHVNDRDSLREHLKAHDIATDIHYPLPDHRQPVFAERYADLTLPNTEQLAKEILTLPLYPEMTDEEVNKVIAAVNAW